MAKQKPTPKRVAISIKVKPATLAAYRATGQGWMTRMNVTLDRGAARLGAK